MKANEFRVTNFVNYNGEMFPIIFIGLDSVVLIRKDQSTFTVKLDRIKPIKLTKEIYLKFGFVETYYGYDHFNEYVEIEQKGNGKSILSINCNEYNAGREFEFVHELQNLCFALTGSELVFSTEP